MIRAFLFITLFVYLPHGLAWQDFAQYPPEVRGALLALEYDERPEGRKDAAEYLIDLGYLEELSDVESLDLSEGHQGLLDAYRGLLSEQEVEELLQPPNEGSSFLLNSIGARGILEALGRQVTPSQLRKLWHTTPTELNKDYFWALGQFRILAEIGHAQTKAVARKLLEDENKFVIDHFDIQIKEILTSNCLEAKKTGHVLEILGLSSDLSSRYLPILEAALKRLVHCESLSDHVFQIEYLGPEGTNLTDELLLLLKHHPDKEQDLLTAIGRIGIKPEHVAEITPFLWCENGRELDAALKCLSTVGPLSIGDTPPEWAKRVASILNQPSPDGFDRGIRQNALKVLWQTKLSSHFRDQIKDLRGPIFDDLVVKILAEEESFFKEPPPKHLSTPGTRYLLYHPQLDLHPHWAALLLKNEDPYMPFKMLGAYPELLAIYYWVNYPTRNLSAQNARNLVSDFEAYWLDGDWDDSKRTFIQTFEKPFFELVMRHKSLWQDEDRETLRNVWQRVEDPSYKAAIDDVIKAIPKPPTWFAQVREKIPDPLEAVIVVLLAWVPFWCLVWVVCLRVTPLTPLSLYLWMDGLKGSVAGVRGPLSALLMLDQFALRDRALDAWVTHHMPDARRQFERQHTVSQRSVHLHLPHRLDEKPVHRTHVFSELMAKPSFCLLITGIGGTGKTSFACWLAHQVMGAPRRPPTQPLNSPIWEETATPISGHRMLPLLLDTEFSGRSLLSVIGEQLKYLIEAEEKPPEVLTKALLRRRRIMVIADHFSEQDDDSRATLINAEDLEINALVITSRKKSEMAHRNPALLTLPSLNGSTLMAFTESLLAKLAPDFSSKELDETYLRIKELSGGFEVTPLVVRLAIEDVQAVHREQAAHLSHTMPELVNNYLTRIRNGIPKNTGVTRTARYAAWECVRRMFRPGDGLKSGVRANVSDEEFKHLPELVEAGLLHWVDTTEDRYRFNLDPVAEYLAANLLVTSEPDCSAVWLAMKQRATHAWEAEQQAKAAEDGKNTEESFVFDRSYAWSYFMEELQKKMEAEGENAADAIGGFLKALHQTVTVFGSAHHLPTDLLTRLSKLTSSDGEDRQAPSHSTGLMARLNHEDASERIHAANRLADLGAGDTRTPVALSERLFIEESPEVARALVRALGRLGANQGLEALILASTSDHAVVRMESARALVHSKDESAARLALLGLVGDQDEAVRQAVETLLVKIPFSEKELTKALVDAKRHLRDPLRDWCLARIGHDMVDVYPALLPYIKDHDDAVVVAAAEALDRLVHVCSEPVGTHLTDALLANLNRSDKVVWTCIRALESACVFGKSRHLAKRAFGPIASLLPQKKQERVRTATTRALFTLFRQGEKPLSLEDLLMWAGNDPSQREGLLHFVCLAEKEARHMTEDLSHMLSDPIPTIRYWAAIALAPFDKGEDTLPILTEALQAPQFNGRIKAAEVMGELGELAKPSLWVLVALASNGSVSETLRETARLAVTKIKRGVTDQVAP